MWGLIPQDNLSGLKGVGVVLHCKWGTKGAQGAFNSHARRPRPSGSHREVFQLGISKTTPKEPSKVTGLRAFNSANGGLSLANEPEEFLLNKGDILLPFRNNRISIGLSVNKAGNEIKI